MKQYPGMESVRKILTFYYREFKRKNPGEYKKKMLILKALTKCPPVCYGKKEKP